MATWVVGVFLAVAAAPHHHLLLCDGRGSARLADDAPASTATRTPSLELPGSVDEPCLACSGDDLAAFAASTAVLSSPFVCVSRLAPDEDGALPEPDASLAASRSPPAVA